MCSMWCMFCVEQKMSAAFDCCHAWPWSCVSFMCCHAQCVCLLLCIAGHQRSKSLCSSNKLPWHMVRFFVKLLLEGSNATNYLREASQPSRQFDRWLWPQQTWGLLSWLTHMPAVEGRGWYFEVRVWRMWGLFSYCILYSSGLRQARTGKLPWWYRSVRPLQTHPCAIFSQIHTHIHVVAFFS